MARAPPRSDVVRAASIESDADTFRYVEGQCDPHAQCEGEAAYGRRFSRLTAQHGGSPESRRTSSTLLTRAVIDEKPTADVAAVMGVT
jgi:hypothetical protein